MATNTTNLGLVKPAASENVDLSVLNGNMDKLDAFAWKEGAWTPELLSGGSGYTYTNLTAKYFKIGRLVMINFLAWGLTITNPTADDVKFSIPFSAASERNYGAFGYNGTGIPGVYPSIAVTTNNGVSASNLSFAKHDPTTGGEASVKGNQLSGTFQFQSIYMAA